MDNIKPPGTGKPTFDPSQNAGPVESKEKFGGKLNRAATDSSASPLSPAVSALKSRFTKRDLEDSTKVDSVYHSAVRELMLDKMPQALQLDETQKQYLTDWMAKDPVIQGKLKSFLMKVLD